MRLKLILEYDGTGFHGWQSQPNLRTVQAELEKALSCIANHPVETQCAGRTDSGVHAKHQVVHFDTHTLRDPHTWQMGVNHYLPKDICVREVSFVAEDFHARYSARARSYEYWIDNRTSAPALFRDYTTWVPQKLNEKTMHLAAQALLGEHDFSALRAADCQAKNPVRTISDISITREKNFIVLRVTANAFLHHMVRNIVGTLLFIGKEKKPPEWMNEVLVSKRRAEAGVTAPPEGLYLVDVRY